MKKLLMMYRISIKIGLLVASVCIHSSSVYACKTQGYSPTEAASLLIDIGSFNTPISHTRLSQNQSSAKVSMSSNDRYIRVKLRTENLSNKNWFISIRDINNRLRETIAPENFTQQGDRQSSNNQFITWTGRLRNHAKEPITLYFMLHLGKDQDNVEVFIDTVQRVKYSDQKNNAKVKFYSSADPDDPKYRDAFCDVFSIDDDGMNEKNCSHISFTQDTEIFSENVAFLAINTTTDYQTQVVRSCTGLLIPPKYLVTNWHCGIDGSHVWSNSTCRRTIVDASWDKDGKSREYLCQQVIHKDKDLDLVLLELAQLKQRHPIPEVTLISVGCENKKDDLGCVTDMRSMIAERLNTNGFHIVHHPLGRSKKISFNCSLHNSNVKNWVSDEFTDFSHRCDTFPGSSGGPIVDLRGRVLGIHHLGYEEVLNNGKCVTDMQNGTNKAVWSNALIKFLNSANSKMKGTAIFNVEEWE